MLAGVDGRNVRPADEPAQRPLPDGELPVAPANRADSSRFSVVWK